MTKPTSRVPDKAAFLPADLQAETDRLLAGRTRDIKLSGALLRLYQHGSWPQRSKIVRTWAVWTILLSLVVVSINALVSPSDFWLFATMIGIFVPVISLGLFLFWRRPRSAWIEGLSVLLILTGIMVAYGVAGFGIGGADSERYLSGSLFVATIGIILFRVEPAWSVALGACCPLVYLAFQLLNPTIEMNEAIGSWLFYSMGIFSVVAARQNAEIIFIKNFLMSLRNDYRSAELNHANRSLETLATRDPLTGLANRRSAADYIAQVWNDETIAKPSVVFAMADIDHFKKLNDSAGHAAGDECLKRVAASIEASVRAGTDLVCRYGGEEFLIVMTDVTPETAWTLAALIRSGVEELAIQNPGLDPAKEAPGLVTVSVGVAFAANGLTPELVAKRADDALYDAKRCGRNRVFMAITPELLLAPGSAAIDMPALP